LNKHGRAKEAEFLHVLADEVTVIEDEAESVLHPGDIACWLAGEPALHTVANRSTAPCGYLIVSPRVTRDVCHHTELGQTLYIEGEASRIENAEREMLKSGRCKSSPGRE
jgi:uncharacterized cupin superfamily protein